MSHPARPARPSRCAFRSARALLAALALLSGIALATDYPLVTTDDLGREVTLERAPRRIVSMIPSHTETVCALDACDRLVGVDRFSNHPAEVAGLPSLGSAFSPDVEAIVALEPDLVLVEEDSGLAGTLEGLGLTVWAGTAQTLDEVFAKFGQVGLLLDRETEAAVLAGEVRGAIEQVAAVAADLDAPRVYFELDATPYSVGPDSFIGALIDAAGGDNIVDAALGEYPQLDPEHVVAADPEVILLADAPFGESAATLAARPGWADLAALDSGRVIEMTQDQVDALNRPGPRLGEAVRLLASWLHPDAF